MSKQAKYTGVNPKFLFVETSALTSKNMSGIGHTLVALLREWQSNKTVGSEFTIVLLVPYDKKAQVDALNLGIKIKRIFIPDIILKALRKYNLLPYMDVFFGKGAYLFPNYWNWPLLFSQSFTYIYDVSYLVYPEFTEAKNQKFLSRYLKVWAHRSDGIVTISHHAKNEIIKYTDIPAKKVKVIYNGVEAVNLKAITKKSIAVLKTKYGITGSYLLFVGNIEPRKNIQRLISAYRLLPEDLRSIYSLVLVGAYGWNNEEIKKTIELAVSDGFKVIKINKFVPDEDITQLYSGAEVLLHPALYEGFGMTPLEAMAVGTPTIVGNNSSLPEVMGGASLYVDAMSEKDISVKIEKLLKDNTLRKKLINAGNIRVRRFTWQRTAEQLANYIREGFNG